MGNNYVVKILVGILLFGSIWGFAEATLGAILHLLHSPHKGVIMASFGVMVLSCAVATLKPRNVLPFALAIGFIASLVKGIDLLLLPLDSHVLRVMVVIPIEAFAFGGLVKVFSHAFHQNRIFRPFIGAISVYAGFFMLSAVYVYAGIGSNFWIGKGLKDILSFTLSNGTMAGIITLLTTDIGFRIGEFVKPFIDRVFEVNRNRFWIAILSFTMLLWVARVISL
ncbi:MAG: hypothetical protein ABH851_00260 [Methanobacteriota archaeon]